MNQPLNTNEAITDAEEALANEVHDLINDLLKTYEARPDQAATNEENDELYDLIEWFAAITMGWPGQGEHLTNMNRRYNSIHCA